MFQTKKWLCNILLNENYIGRIFCRPVIYLLSSFNHNANLYVLKLYDLRYLYKRHKKRSFYDTYDSTKLSLPQRGNSTEHIVLHSGDISKELSCFTTNSGSSHFCCSFSNSDNDLESGPVSPLQSNRSHYSNLVKSMSCLTYAMMDDVSVATTARHNEKCGEDTVILNHTAARIRKKENLANLQARLNELDKHLDQITRLKTDSSTTLGSQKKTSIAVKDKYILTVR